MTSAPAAALLDRVRRLSDYSLLRHPDLAPQRLSQQPWQLLGLARARVEQGLLTDGRALFMQAARAADAPTVLRRMVGLELCALRMRTQLAVHEALAEGRALAAAGRDELSPVDSLEVQRLALRLEQLATEHAELPLDQAQALPAAQLALASALHVQGLIQQAHRLELDHAMAVPDARGTTLLSRLAERARMHHDFGAAGAARVARARRLLSNGASRHLVLAELKRAERLYATIDHRTGLVRVQAERLRLALLHGQAQFSAFESLLDAYRKAEDYGSSLSLLVELAEEALAREQLRQAQNYRQRALRIAQQSGEVLELDTLRLSLVASLNRRGNYAKAIELGEAALTERLPRMRAATYHRLLGGAYGGLHDERALAHFECASELFGELQAWDQVSETAAQLAEYQEHPDAHTESYDALRQWCERDMEEGDYPAAFAKCLQLGQRELRQASAASPGEREDHQRAAEEALCQAQKLLPLLPPAYNAKQQAELSQLQAAICLGRRDLPGFEHHCRESIQQFLAADYTTEATRLQYSLGCHALRQASLAEGGGYYAMAENLLQAAIRTYTEQDMREHSADSHLMLARLHLTASDKRPAAGAHMLHAALEHLQAAGTDLDAVAADVAAKSSLGSVTPGQRSGRAQQVYSLTQLILTRLGQTAQLWQSVQCSKSRAMAEAIGLNAPPPTALVTRLERCAQAREYFRQELELVARWRLAGARDRPALKHALNALRQRMAREQALAEYLALRGSKAITAAELKPLLPPNAACVDWVTIDDRIHLLIARGEGPPQRVALPYRQEDILRYVRRHLKPERLEHTLRVEPERLRELDGLIAPLATLCHAEELLVLVPTGPLNAIPLHALELAGQPLLRRNPVVFAPNLTLTQQCIARRSLPAQAPTPRLAVVGAPAEPSAAPLTRALERNHEATVLQPPRDGDSLRKAFGMYERVHCGGTAHEDHVQPLRSHIAGPGQTRLSINDLYLLPQVPADLVTLTSQVASSPADSSPASTGPAFLASALLTAGTRSVVSPLWTSKSPADTETISRFYANLEQGLSKAESLRKACLDTASQPGQRAPYYWASYILNGDWQ